MADIAMEAMAHRNRWFTYKKNGGSFHSFLYVYQRVKPPEIVDLPIENCNFP